MLLNILRQLPAVKGLLEMHLAGEILKNLLARLEEICHARAEQAFARSDEELPGFPRCFVVVEDVLQEFIADQRGDELHFADFAFDELSRFSLVNAGSIIVELLEYVGSLLMTEFDQFHQNIMVLIA